MEVESATEAPIGVEPGAIPGTPLRPKLFEAGLFLVVVVVPLAFLPFATSPFGDLKLVALALGVFLLWASAPPVDRRIASLAGCWFGASVLGAMFGVDPGRSLTGTENSPGGLALVLVCAYLVSIGAAMSREYRDRLPTWVAGASAAVAVVVIVWRVWPDAFSSMPRVGFSASTLGVGPFMAAFLALGLLALPHLKLPLWQLGLGALLFGLALGGTPHRAALVSTAIGFVFSVWRAGLSRKVVAIVAVAASVSFLGWGLWPAGGPTTPGAGGGAAVLDQAFTGKPSGSHRLDTLVLIARSTADRPIFGWGPGNTLSAWAEGLRPADFPVTERFTDAHNIFVEQLAATGYIGVLAFLALALVLTIRVLKPPRPTGWVAGAVVVLILLHLVQPMSVALTGLTFLLVGMASSEDGQPSVGREGVWWAVRKATGVLLICTLLISILTLLSSFLEEYESRYFTPDHGGLRLANAMTPWRISASSALAMQLALDGRAGDGARRTEAVELANRMLEQHPQDPDVYYDAVAVYTLVMDPEGANLVIEQFKERFPLLPPPVIDATTVGPAEPVG